MNIRMYLIGCLCILFTPLYGQIEKGKWLVGGSTSFTQTHFENRPNQNYVYVGPQLGYLIKKRISA